MLPNLTRNEAIERAALVTVQRYLIELDLVTGGQGVPPAGGGERSDPGNTSSEKTFRSTTTVEFEALPGADTYIDLAADRVHSAVLNGYAIDVSGYDESNGIGLKGLAPHNVLVVSADCRYSHTGEGLHRFVDPVDGHVYLYSQFETADAKRMFACFDQPDIKAAFDITVTAPAHWQVISNGALRSVVEHGEAERQVVEQFVRHHDAREAPLGQRCHRLDGLGVLGPLHCRRLDRNVAVPLQARVRPPVSSHRSCQGARPRSHLHHREVGGAAEALPLGVDPARQDRAEHRPHLGRGDEVAAPAGTSDLGVEAVGAVERHRHELVEPDHPACGGDGLGDVVSGRRHR